MRAFETVIAKRSSLNLLGTYFDAEKGDFFETDDAGPDEPSDSFYEYLWGGWQMLGNMQCRDWYELVTPPLLKYCSAQAGGHLWFQTVNYKTGAPAGDGTLSELSSFYAELVAKSGHRDVGDAFYDSWTAVLDRYTLFPETIDWRTMAIADAAYAFRPEYANSAFDLWFLTRDEKYRRTAYQYFIALRDNCRVANGYTSLKDIRTRPMTPADHFPAYSFSENFKYLYLMFADSPRFDAANYYLNTEGKILRGLVRQ